MHIGSESKHENKYKNKTKKQQRTCHKNSQNILQLFDETTNRKNTIKTANKAHRIRKQQKQREKKNK